MISELSKAGLSAAAAALAIAVYILDQGYVPAKVDASPATLLAVQAAGAVGVETAAHRRMPDDRLQRPHPVRLALPFPRPDRNSRVTRLVQGPSLVQGKPAPWPD